MNDFEIIIDNKKYEFIDNICYQDKLYVAYEDDNNIYISEYELTDDGIVFNKIDDNTFKLVKELMKL